MTNICQNIITSDKTELNSNKKITSEKSPKTNVDTVVSFEAVSKSEVCKQKPPELIVDSNQSYSSSISLSSSFSSSDSSSFSNNRLPTKGKHITTSASKVKVQNNYVETNELDLDLDNNFRRNFQLESNSNQTLRMNFNREDMASMYDNEPQFEQESLISTNENSGSF